MAKPSVQTPHQPTGASRLQGLAPPVMFVAASYLVTVDLLEPASILYILSFLGLLWFVIELGFVRGTHGANRFGPDPAG